MLSEILTGRIQAIKNAQAARADARISVRRHDRILERELLRNFAAIQAACKSGTEQIRIEFPDSRIEFLEIPSRAFTIRKPMFPAVVLNVEISADGAAISIQAERRRTANALPYSSKDVVRIAVNDDDSIYYVHGDESIPLHADQVAEIILRPLLEALA
jgi:hypothetical protein